MPQPGDIHYNPAVDYYRLLSIPSSASSDEIRRVFRQKAKDLHPDHNPTRKAWAHQQFQQLNVAYSVLADPALRAEYDRQRLFYLQQAFHASPAQAASVRRASSRQRMMQLVVWIVVVIVGAFAYFLAKPGKGDSSSFSSQPVFDIPDVSPVYIWVPYEKHGCTGPNVQIHFPAQDQAMGQEFMPRITAAGPNFVSYKLMLGIFRTASDEQIRWEWLGSGQQPVQQETLFDDGNGHSSHVLAAGKYVLRLIVQRQDQELRTCDSMFSAVP